MLAESWCPNLTAIKSAGLELPEKHVQYLKAYTDNFGL